MGILRQLESKLNEIFGKKAPAMPKDIQTTLVAWAPWVSLIIGVLSLLSALALWRWAHAVDNLNDYVRSLDPAYGQVDYRIPHVVSRLSAWVWIGLLALLAEAVMYLLAFPGLSDRKKAGWNYLYYGALLNVAYALVTLFTAYDVVGHFVSALVSAVIGFYLLFQIRPAYLGHAPKTPVKPSEPAPPAGKS